ncbi:immunoglobulin lambda-1 light chain-like [Mustelus asterias]
MNVLAVLQSRLTLMMTVTVISDTQSQVSQSPGHMIVKIGENITIACAFTPPSDNSEVNIFWWRLGESVFMQPSSDRRKHFFKRKGQGSFLLLNVRFQDAGVYCCGVQKGRARMTNGTGSTIVVHASPHEPTIQWKMSDGNSNTYLHLECETVDFYPAAITFHWYKNGSRITTGIKTTKRLNESGLYEATSILQVSQPIQIGTPYICLVSHGTLQAPKLSVHLVSSSNSDTGIKFVLLTAGCVVSGLVCLVLVTIIGKQCALRTCKVTAGDVSPPSAETIRERSDNGNLAYAALNTIGTAKRGMQKQKENCTEYAAVKLEPNERNLAFFGRDLIYK